ncbi:MAG: AraC family transcriptional regulator [Ruminococcus sp.]|jgi:AraC-like DNA-binding protein/mannose-6-phosphate isomerase-like protein (cupin superfamily)|nr:AraC family transcriptional regulator [uncultured Schaedlerella sp.]MCI8767055.1 AraC family transcriptional regulator [Ruminococcus sp.]MCI9330492.1 AraC family transcriptional regulator [Ruminococcus sp.]NBI98665.1 AraC family transcriptional regulator [Lachnospiraceae bacterium]
MEFSHELIMPNQGLPFKVFLFEGGEGNYFRDKHWHRSIELFAVYEGALKFYLNEEIFPLGTGKFMLVNSNEIHSVDSPEPNRTIVLQIPLKTFEDYYTGEQFIRFTHDPLPRDGQVMKLIGDIFEACEERACGYEMKAKGLYYMLLYLLVTEYRETDVTPDMVKWHKKLNRLSLIADYIKENYASELSLEALAEIFGYSPTYLSRMFQKYAGINYKSYLQSIRVERAFQELANTEHTISETAMNNGFPNSKALAKAFQKKYGMLPSEYRGMQRQKKTRK